MLHHASSKSPFNAAGACWQSPDCRAGRAIRQCRWASDDCL